MTSTDFLYPFLEGDERDVDALLADLARSARGKAEESASLCRATVARCASDVARAAAAMASAFRAGGRLLTFGNGGSATDAHLAAERFSCTAPPVPGLAAWCLADESAVLTALANDVGFDVVFARQLAAFGHAGDIALGFSTSGTSTDVVQAFRAARAAGMVTVGLAGYDGGAMASSGDIDHCFVVRSQSVHRIQEAQTAMVAELHRAVVRELGREPAT